jgi:hypothetical protein
MVPFAIKSPDTFSVCAPVGIVRVATLLFPLVPYVIVSAVPSSSVSGCGRTDTPSHRTSTLTEQLTPAGSVHTMLLEFTGWLMTYFGVGEHPDNPRRTAIVRAVCCTRSRVIGSS